jgi:hypothetical protein
MVSLTEGGPHHWDSVSLHVLCQSHLNRASPALNWGYGGHRSLVKVTWNPQQGQGDPGRSGLAPEGPGKSLGFPEPKRPQGSLGKPVEIRKATEDLRKPLGHPWKPRRLQGTGETPGTSGCPREARRSPWDVRAARGGPGKILGRPGRPRRPQRYLGKSLGRPESPGRPGEAPGTSWETQEDPRETLRNPA